MILVVSTCKYRLSEEEFVDPVIDIIREAGLDYTLKRYSEELNFTRYTKVIICGTALKDFDYMNYIDNFRGLTRYRGGILGICAGYHILGLIHGNNPLEMRRIGVYKVKVVAPSPLIDRGEVKAYFLHNYALKNVEKPLIALGLVNGEVAIYKVMGKNQFGLAFHPEVLNKSIIRNFLNHSDK
jgi:GMP synthase (glutamine-hydrolysing)